MTSSSSKHEPGEFNYRTNELLAVACLSMDRAFAVCIDGVVFSIFSFDGAADLRKAISRLPDTGSIQIIRYRAGADDMRFCSIGLHSEPVQHPFTPLTALRLKASWEREMRDFHNRPRAAFERILKYQADAALTGDNIFKVEAESMPYAAFGGVRFEGEVALQQEVIRGGRGYFRIGRNSATYGTILDTTGINSLKVETNPSGSFYAATTIRRLPKDEIEEIRQNTVGSRVFSSHLKREVFDPQEIAELEPFGFTHSIVLLDSSSIEIQRRAEAYEHQLLHQGIAVTRPRLHLGRTLMSCLPGQGYLHPAPLYYDLDTCAEAVTSFHGLRQ